MSDPLCRLHVQSREAVALAPGLVEGSAEMLGLSSPDRVRLRALTVEVLAAVLQDAFGPEDQVDLDLEVLRAPGEMRLVLRDRGAPLDFGASYPPRVADLIRLGFADGLTFANEARRSPSTSRTSRSPTSSSSPRPRPT